MAGRDAVVRALEGSVAGEVVAPGDRTYETARRVWNAMVDRRPAAIVRCVQASDVVASLRAAREFALPVAVRGGGHNVAGNAVCDGGVVIDLSAQKAIHVDPVRRIARVQPGVLLGELDRATQRFGLATPTGNVSMTGVAGLTLGGGLGWIARKYGPACDNLVSAEVVTVNGDLVSAGADENADLLWGLRGGGGNFGVVTSFEYRLHSVGPQVLAGGVLHDFREAREVFRFVREFIDEAPDELSLTVSTFRASTALPVPADVHGELVTVLAVCYVGDLDAGERALRPLRAFGHPLADSIAPKSYTALQSGSDAAYPSGQQNYWKAHYLSDLSDDAIDTIIAHAPRLRSPQSSFYLQHLDGAISRGTAETAAFGHRSALFDFAILGVWQDPAENAEHIDWARGFADAMQPHATGVYVNNLGVEGSDRVRAAYAPATYQRLVKLKQAYDPENVLRLNQNISPDA